MNIIKDWNVIGFRKRFYVVSGVLLIVALVSLLVNGLNLGIDFKSGTVLQLQLNGSFSASEIRQVLHEHGLGDSRIREVGGEGLVEVHTRLLSRNEESELIAALKEKWPELAYSGNTVAPIFSKELSKQAFVGVLIATALMLLYISWRFEFRFGVTAVVALLHDTLLVLGMFSLFQWEVNASFVAALLTIVGYSINDTIVIFDRIRENLKKAEKESYAAVVNTSILETVTRSINTSLTTLFVIGAVLFFGGVTLQSFALALFVGVISGTYSSIFVAGSLWVDWRQFTERRAKERAAFSSHRV